jgi:hypothetical protein
MNDGVKILLERMKTNPEEFVSEHGSSKWGSLIVAYKEFLEPEDRQALTDSMNVVLQQRFTEKVMEELIDPNKNKINLIQSNTTTGTWGNTNAVYLDAQRYQTEQLRVQLDAQRIAMEQEENKKPATIFGKLFNYQ